MDKVTFQRVSYKGPAWEVDAGVKLGSAAENSFKFNVSCFVYDFMWNVLFVE
jgi:hypothetical protein